MQIIFAPKLPASSKPRLRRSTGAGALTSGRFVSRTRKAVSYAPPAARSRSSTSRNDRERSDPRSGPAIDDAVDPAPCRVIGVQRSVRSWCYPAGTMLCPVRLDVLGWKPRESIGKDLIASARRPIRERLKDDLSAGLHSRSEVT